jgi:hypothetical protein
LISSEEFSSALWWVECGRAFAVHKNGYQDQIMNIFFEEKKFHSLQTLLHKYGFRRIRAVSDALPNVLIYRHDLFIRGDIDLCKNIKRNKNPPKVKSSTVQEEIDTNKIPLPKQDLHDDDDLHSFDWRILSPFDLTPFPIQEKLFPNEISFPKQALHDEYEVCSLDCFSLSCEDLILH